MPTIEDWIADRTRQAELGPATRRVVEILGTQPQLASYASTADLAKRARVNVATVVRTARMLGFSGWPELRLELRSRYLATLSANQVLAEHRGVVSDPITAAVRRDIDNLETLARTLDVAAVREAARAIHEAPRTLVIGSGSFAAPGLQLAHLAQTMGRDVILQQHFGTMLVNSVNRLRPGDCLVTVNLWWLPREILEATTMAYEREIGTCVLTDSRSTALAEVAQHLIVVPSEGISSFPSLTAAMAVVHAILVELARLGGEETTEAMARAEAGWARMGLFND
jgi:DNA-binding MurR/RpiR family transcriptional regulator